MTLEFTKNEGVWEAHFKADGVFALHIEGVPESEVQVYQSTAEGGKYAFVRDSYQHPAYGKVYDFDYIGEVFPKFIKVVCANQPTYAEVVSNGEITELKFQSKSVKLTSNGAKTIKPDAGFAALSSVRVNVDVSGGGSGSGELKRDDVNFFDYDGTLLYSYSWDEAKKLTELPALPVHDGLEVREWNYTLEDIKAQGVKAISDEYDTYHFYAKDVVINGTKYSAYTESGKLEVVSGQTAYALLLTEEPKVGDFAIGGYYYGDDEWELWYDGDALYKLEVKDVFSTIGKADVGACIYENGEQVTTDHVIIIPRGEEHLPWIDAYQFLSVLSIPNTIVSAGSPSISYAYIIGEVKIPISLRASSGDNYSIIYYCSLSSIHVNGAIESLDGYAYRCYYRDMFRTSSRSAVMYIIGHSEVSSYYKISPSINYIGEIDVKDYDNHNMPVIDFSEHTFVPPLGYIRYSSYKPALIIVPDELYDEWVETTNWSELAFMIQPASECEAFIRK